MYIALIKIGVFFLLLSLLATTVDAMTITTNAALRREATPIIQKISNSTGKSWANSRINLYGETLKYANKLYGDTAKQYRTEIAKGVTQYLSDISQGLYTFDITNSERNTIENIILMYQRDFADELQKYINKYNDNDKREAGDIHFTVRSREMNIDINVNTYKFTQSQDMKDMELDVRMNIRISGKEIGGEVSMSVDGKIMLIGEDLYITLRDFSFFTNIENSSFEELRPILSEIRGKTYHQKIDKYLFEGLQESTRSIEITEKLISILREQSILTPIAKQGDDYILMFNKSAIKKITSLTNQSAITHITLQDMMIPLDIRTDGKDITLQGYYKDTELKAHIGREPDNTIILDINAREYGSYVWNWKLSKTPMYWAFAGASEEYTIDAQATKNRANATIKKGDKIVANAHINSAGINAWTYDISALWEHIQYDWEAGDSKSEDVSMKLWGAFRDEFGTFTLVPPTIYEEFENSLYKKTERDNQRKSDIANASWNIDYTHTLPLIPKDGCIHSIKTKGYGWNSFEYIRDPKNLSSGRCKDGYSYLLMRNNEGEKVYILIAKVETPEAANYDASKVDISRASYETIIGNITNTGITSTNPSNWYYIYTPYVTGDTEDDTYIY